MSSFHADFTSAPDPAKVMELLSSMSEKDREAVMKQATEQMLGPCSLRTKRAPKGFRVHIPYNDS